jgi:hypothetical protein
MDDFRLEFHVKFWNVIFGLSSLGLLAVSLSKRLVTTYLQDQKGIINPEHTIQTFTALKTLYKEVFMCAIHDTKTKFCF